MQVDATWKSVPWSDESTFEIVFDNHGHDFLWAKEERDHPDCYKFQDLSLAWGYVSARDSTRGLKAGTKVIA